MKPRNLIILLVLIAAINPLRGQDEAPWPPDPSEIFAEGVEILETRIIEPTSSPQPSDLWDDERRELYVVDSETGERRAYPYPKNVVSVQWPQVLDDGSWLVPVKEIIPDTDRLKSWVWSLDLISGAFSRYDWPCNPDDDLYVQTILENPWVFTKDSLTGYVYLCETDTGRVSEPLPEGWDWGLEQPVSVSDEGRWLAFLACEADSICENTRVFSYEIATGQLNILGAFASDYRLRFSRWVDSQVLIVAGKMVEYANDVYDYSFYIVDAAQPDSLGYAFALSGVWSEYYDNPPRYEIVGNTEGDPNGLRCFWTVYTIGTRELATYDLGTLCKPEIGKVGEDAYYRDVPDYRSSSATLVRFNPITGERVDFFTGEIERVVWVSADEKYAELVLDSSGSVDIYPYLPWDQWGTPTSARLAYVDLTTDTILFDIPAGWTGTEGWAGPLSGIVHLGENRFMGVVIDERSGSYASLFTLSDGEYVETHLLDNVELYSRERLLFWVDGTHHSAGMSMYDVETEAITPVIKPFDSERYMVHFGDYVDDWWWYSHWFSGDEVSLFMISENDSSYILRLRYVRYTIRLP
jgi:hypothetical protein